MGALLWLAAHLVPALTASAHGMTQAVVLVLLIAAAVAVYGLLLALFGVVRWGKAVRAIRQTASSDLRG
jgi:putative peptidoglycan lipid II flippase